MSELGEIIDDVTASQNLLDLIFNPTVDHAFKKQELIKYREKILNPNHSELQQENHLNKVIQPNTVICEAPESIPKILCDKCFEEVKARDFGLHITVCYDLGCAKNRLKRVRSSNSTKVCYTDSNSDSSDDIYDPHPSSKMAL
ncbi:hypothetical protein RF11_10158 [Thelohanellus kitauei]|uniref:Uncharacterized protein n=1 Tax=Thelohanellus kitauei TaxID=669202 RepID=A0A0C2MWS1_THEKT|nr:hypothetical protein RF11_10158 [Thelohanellus kitauei]